MNAFYDRQHEMSELTRAWEQGSTELRLLYGRRRVGKTCLLQHFFSDNRPHCYFLASAMTATNNLERLAQSLINSSTKKRKLKPSNLSSFWSILQFYGEMARDRRFALVLDEFQYLVEADPSIPSQIQAWWDDTISTQSQAYIVLCGSHIGMMEALTRSSQPLYARFTSRTRLQPMTYYNSTLFYSDSNWSVRDKLTAYGVLGGTPKYHAAFTPKEDLASNIISQVLSPDGLLHSEPEVAISSSSIRDTALYNSILQIVASGETQKSRIEQKAGVTSSQFIYCIQTLMELEWIRKERPFGDDSPKRTIYTISDHFIHFWYRFVKALEGELEFGITADVYKSRVRPYINDYMGRYVFEDICMQYLKKNAASKHGLQIRNAGRYWNRDGSVEIDIVAELSDKEILACECKWSSSPVGVGVYYDLMNKKALLPPPMCTQAAHYAIFSMAGFDEKIIETAKRDNLILITGDDLLDIEDDK